MRHRGHRGTMCRMEDRLGSAGDSRFTTRLRPGLRSDGRYGASSGGGATRLRSGVPGWRSHSTSSGCEQWCHARSGTTFVRGLSWNASACGTRARSGAAAWLKELKESRTTRRSLCVSCCAETGAGLPRFLSSSGLVWTAPRLAAALWMMPKATALTMATWKATGWMMPTSKALTRVTWKATATA
jgi:hypothetical protein